VGNFFRKGLEASGYKP